MHNGQVCAAGSRIFVQEGIYDAFIKAFSTASKSLKLGHGFDPSITQGPCVSQTQMEVNTLFPDIRLSASDINVHSVSWAISSPVNRRVLLC